MAKKELADTVNGHSPYEAVSALQKAIRRGELDNAAYWCTDLLQSGHAWWVWKRLLVMCTEDVGPAWPEGPAVIRALYENWRGFGKDELFVYDAVVRLCRAPKTRLVDTLASVHQMAHSELRREVPDEALDEHTVRGLRMGRATTDFFFDVAAVVCPEVEDDDAELYEQLERKLWKAGYSMANAEQRDLADSPEYKPEVKT